MGALSGRRLFFAIAASILSVGTLGACRDVYVDLRLEGAGRYEDIIVEWRTPTERLFRESMEETPIAGPIELPTTLRLRPPAYLPPEALREVGVRLRSRDSGLVAGGAISFTFDQGERAAATLPVRWRFERRELAFADGAPGSAQDLVAAQLNCHPGIDLVALRERQLTFLFNDGAAQFREVPLNVAQLPSHPPVPTRLWADDLNNDGRVDLVGGTTQNLMIFHNRSTAASCENIGAAAQGITLPMQVDFRTFRAGARPYPDLAILDVSYTGPLMRFVQNSLNAGQMGDPSFAQTATADPNGSVYQLARVRLPGDDIDDFVIVHCTDTLPEISVLISQAGGTPATWRTVTNRTGRKTPCVMTAADFDGSGAAQIILGSRDEKTLAHILVNSDGSLTYGAISTLSFSRGGLGNLAPGDLDGDGLLDVTLGHNSQPLLGISRGTGGGALEPMANLDARTSLGVTRYLSQPLARPVAVADFDGDGRLDLATGSADPHGVVVFLNRSAD